MVEPTLPVSFALSAVKDLEEMRQDYADQGVPEIGKRFLGEIMALAEGLCRHPDRGRIVPEFGQSFLRELIHPPFRIVYRRDAERVRIVRIWRSERALRLP